MVRLQPKYNKMKIQKNNLKDTLKKLSAIVEWFDEQSEIDIEAGLVKVKEAAELISLSRERLKEVENEFETVKKSMEEGN